MHNPCKLSAVMRSLNGQKKKKKAAECQKPEMVSRERPVPSIAPVEAGRRVRSLCFI